MSDAFLIDIDQAALVKGLAEEGQPDWDAVRVRAWLIEHDFISTPDGWVCEELSLGLLCKGEYKIIRRIA